MIQLIGPGGAGKTTIGAALAERLRARFVDLDAEFRFRHGDISSYFDERGYEAYASQNVDLFSDLAGGQDGPDVVALSSGFMTYADDVHPAYPVWRRRVALSPSTLVLLPSMQFETCVQETVRRQLGRPFARSAEREEQVIPHVCPCAPHRPSRPRRRSGRRSGSIGCGRRRSRSSV